MANRFAVLIVLLCATFARGQVTPVRVPDGGIEPRAAIDAKGIIHLVYYKGPDSRGDLFYTTTTDGKKFTPALQVNSQKGSALSVGAVRGAQLALGRDGRVHVAWMGSAIAEPKAPGNATPLLYTRLGLDGVFEPQRNVISKYVGLDGGPSITSDDAGHVFIAWHAPSKANASEADRRVWLARSINDGRTFEPEVTVAGEGICACCALKIAITDGGKIMGLYRQAKERTQRGAAAFSYSFMANAGSELEIAPMESAACILSTFDLAQTTAHTVAAYETKGDLSIAMVPRNTQSRGMVVEVGAGKHPSLAVNKKDELLVARAVGTGWGKGGSIAWQVYDADGKPIDGQAGKADGLPVWSYPSAIATPDGGFLIFY